jgi:hypothetical protein
MSGFVPETIAPEVDFISVHIYPEQGKADEAVEGLKKFVVGKPVVVEETFPLSCDAPTLREFMRRGRSMSSGWVGHYMGESLDDLHALKAAGTISAGQELMRQWLLLFREMRSEAVHPIKER